MSSRPCSPLASDKLKKAVLAFSDLVEQYPEKTRKELLQKIELSFDLSPLECAFLDKCLSERGEQEKS
ncbi:hypothetical protein [Desulfofustis limnaeus]|jgi:hypothetical protein|uniref:Uncharacterized protein n=1 Tax=Desulfofustis limnaeus TaxID=2740163 RepID=A0ABN6M2E7_9BACT|nr:hypothetical protein [Desulfofustis limnaeus]MDX9894757.1 hypothetical protein [Desulfofustis sp.]BDD87097.1 hypothetical protein DPPLL_14620 [Desulfofustis limnaeus]